MDLYYIYIYDIEGVFTMDGTVTTKMHERVDLGAPHRKLAFMWHHMNLDMVEHMDFVLV